MMKKNLFSLFASVMLFPGIGKIAAQNAAMPSLKETFKNDFLIGFAINTHQIEERDMVADNLIKQQFNAATPENIMKVEIIQPGWNAYKFELADMLVASAVKYNIKIKLDIYLGLLYNFKAFYLILKLTNKFCEDKIKSIK